MREELRDQHTRLGGNGEVKLPYQGNRQNASANDTSNEGSDEEHSRSDQDGFHAQAAAAAAARGMMFPPYLAAANARGAGALGKKDPDAAGPDGDDAEEANAAAAAAAHANEDRARRLMLAAAGAPGFGAPFLHPHLGGFGLGAAALHPHLFSQQALMMAQQPSAAAMLQANRAREFAQFEAANMAAAAGINPLLMGGQRRPPPGFHDNLRLHELVSSPGNNKREREELEREIDENYAKAAKLSRQYL